MKLLTCHIENFGVLSGYDLRFDENLTIIFEANGFGKTTLAAFIKAMFYGMPRAVKNPAKNERKKYMPWQGGRYGGNLQFEEKGKQYRIERFFGQTPRQDSFALYTLDPLSKSADYTENIGLELFQLDVESYEKSTYMPQNYDSSVFSTDMISAKLTDLAEETADIGQYEKAVALLKEKRSALMPYRGSGGKIEQDRMKLRQLEEAIGEGPGIRGEIDAAEQSKESLAAGAKEAEDKIRRIREEISRAGEAQLVQTARKRQQELQEEAEELEASLETLLARYPKGLPREEDLSAVSDCLDQMLRLEGLAESLAGEEAPEPVPEKKKESRLYLIFMFAGLPLLLAGVFCLYGHYNLPGICCFAAGAAAVLIGNFLNFKRMSRRFQELQQPEETKTALAEVRLRTWRQQSGEYQKQIEDFAARYGLDEVPKNRTDILQLRDDLQKEAQLKEQLDKKEGQLARFQEENRRLLSQENPAGQADLQTLKDRESTLHKERDEAFKAMAALESRLKELQGELEALPQLEDERDFWQASYETDRKHLEILDGTIALLAKAKEKLDMDYIAPLRERFSHYIELILKEEDFPVFLNQNLEPMPEQAGEARALTSFSRGYADIISICMRFALVDALFPQTRPFMILDDPFVNLDDAHMKEALSLLRRLSGEKQVIYLVCSSSRC